MKCLGDKEAPGTSFGYSCSGQYRDDEEGSNTRGDGSTHRTNGCPMSPTCRAQSPSLTPAELNEQEMRLEELLAQTQLPFLDRVGCGRGKQARNGSSGAKCTLQAAPLAGKDMQGEHSNTAALGTQGLASGTLVSHQLQVWLAGLGRGDERAWERAPIVCIWGLCDLQKWLH